MFGVGILLLLGLAALAIYWLTGRRPLPPVASPLAPPAMPIVLDPLSDLMNALADGVCICEPSGKILKANSSMAHWLGLASPETLTGRMLGDVLGAQSATVLVEQFARLLAAPNASLMLEHELALAEARQLPVELRLSTYPWHDGAQACLLQMHDLSQNKKYEEMWATQRMVDEVTSLPNRRMLMDRLQQALALGRRGGGICAVLLIDLDHFKRINETRGHTIGDGLLAQAAQRLRETVREADTVARFGGDEFVVILAEADHKKEPLRVEYAAKRIVAAFQRPFVFDGMQVVTTASVGIAVAPEDGDDADTLIRNADTAMYEVKNSTRNGFCLFNRDMNVRVQTILRIDAQLRGALERQQFRVVFQPIVDAHSRRIMKVEALLRWRSETLGDVAPDLFVPVAEETGQIVAIGAWVLEESCRKLLQLQALRGDAEGLTVSVNVSARQLQDPHFTATVNDILKRTGMPPEQLELELTERILIDDNPAVLETMATLRKRGISLSLDDFGTGYSSLSYLTRFPLSTVKLDRSFVRDIETNPQSLNLATAVIALCGSLGLALVAEGVESSDQADLLRAQGCRYLQGYYFGRPVSAEELPALAGFQCETVTI